MEAGVKEDRDQGWSEWVSVSRLTKTLGFSPVDTSRRADVPDCKGSGDENRVEEVSGGLDCSIWGGVTVGAGCS